MFSFMFVRFVSSGIVSLQQEEVGGVFALLSSSLCLGIMFVLFIIFVIGLWRTFEKAQQPGWGALIPVYNVYLLIRIAGRPGWWLLLLFVPLVNVVVWAIVTMEIAQAFGKTPAWGLVMLFLLNGLGFLILGFGDAEYVGPPSVSAS